MLLIALAVIIALVWLYILFFRKMLFDYLLSKWPDETTAFLKFENALWLQSRTILLARFYWIAGALVALQQMAVAAGVDVTPFIDQFTQDIPEKWRQLSIAAFMAVTGIGFEWLRRQSSMPVSPEVDPDPENLK